MTTIKKSELNKLVEDITKKVLNEDNELMNKIIKNPETGRNIKVSSALSYPDDSKVYKIAHSIVSKEGNNPNHINNEKAKHDSAKSYAKDIMKGNLSWDHLKKELWSNVSYDPPSERQDNYNNSLNLIKSYYKKYKKK